MNRWMSSVMLVAMLVGFRVLGAYGYLPGNFQPLCALLLLSVVYLKGAQRWWIPALAWLLSDPIANAIQDAPLFSIDHVVIFAGLAAMWPLAVWMRRDVAVAKSLVGCVLGAVVFYVVTCFISFFSLPELYARSGEGLLQAMWTGPASLSPTWLFLRNGVAANVLFGAMFLLAQKPFSYYFAASRGAAAAAPAKVG